MEVPKLIILLCCIYYSYASHQHSHTIPVEGYETKLENLGQHVDIPETPVKVIKITKTVAIKVPVPYPVKVIQKVPYPVHVSKPYPVPVPQIVHVPAPTHKYGVHAASSQGNVHDSPYQAQEGHDSTDGHSFGPVNVHSLAGGNSEHSFGGGSSEHSFGGGNSGHHNTESFADEFPSSEGSYGGSSYDTPSHTFYGATGNHEGSNSLESKNYDQAIQEYLQKVNSGGSHGTGAGAGYYH